jgi:hypothetical protein
LSSTTSTTPRIRFLQHIAWLVTPLLVDYFASRRLVDDSLPPPRVRVPQHVARLVMRLVVDYFDYAACPVASARRAARRRLLRLAQARQ